MADDPTNPNPDPTQSTEPAAPPTPDAPKRVTIEVEEGLWPNGETFNPERAVHTLRTVRDENKTLKDQLKAITEERDTLRSASMTEEERIRAEAETAKNEAIALSERLRQTNLENAVLKEGRDLNLIDPDAAVKLLPNEQVQYDDAGRPTNVKPLLQELVAQKAWLTGVTGGFNPTNPAGNRSQGSLTPDQIKQMSQKEIIERWTEVQQAMAKQQ